MIIAPENFRDEELAEPKAIFENAGITVTVASRNCETARGMLGATADVDKDIADVNVADYDAVVFVGGTGATVYFNDPTAHQIAKDAASQGKVLAAICFSPSTLANAGVLEGKKATVFSSEADNLKAKGAEYTGADVEQDGKIITGNGPGAATKFGKTILNALE